MRRLPPVELVPFTEDLLPAVQVWFYDAEVQRWLGGPDWPAREFDHGREGFGEEFRGRLVLRSHSWVALDGRGVPVAHIGGEVYDRWCRYRETPAGPVVDRIEPGPSLGFAYVVDPGQRLRGYGTSTVLAMIGAAEVADVVVFAAGIEPDNTASVRCVAAAGFRAQDSEPDWEGIVHHVWRRERTSATSNQRNQRPA
ncbi:GNAT family N-acetyltransferase [Actinoplanes sp. LDG1-06]|uniref:GNAT family N-acetyltransferase n=1 Tax=Paractinoplanes ovalisporus TaxID=2810368 RepID=A0ABS2ANG3_9ACTN|nr:GNAT family N-acetyltransferase [Actinoplanes ovalisporus]MBM2621402.1 GNAT family N-acetyltransferase [Actinoplanes ovalisporus]